MKNKLASSAILVLAAIMVLSILAGARGTDLGANPTSQAYTWINMNPVIAPSGRSHTAMAYDSNNGVVVLFGGYDGINLLSDTWVYSVRTNTWTKMNPSVSPPARFQHAMAYDSMNKVVVLFGGWDNADEWPPTHVLCDTWTYDVNTNSWAEKDPIDHPSGRLGHAMVYDSLHDEILLVGGRVGYSFLGDTWSYSVSTNTWALRNPTGDYFYPRAASPMAYDTENNIAVVFGGDLWGSGAGADDTWKYDSTANSWHRRYPSAYPLGRYSHRLVYDSARKVCVLFGGEVHPIGRLGDTWLYDANTNTWQKESPSASPSPRSGFGMVYDSLNKVVVLFGGSDQLDNKLGDTWIYGNLPSTIDIDPDTLTLKSKGKFVTCHIELPESYDVADIDISTILLNDAVPAEPKPTEIGDYDGDSIPDLMVKFSGAAVQAILEAGEEVEMTLSGQLTDGTLFQGTDTIRVID